MTKKQILHIFLRKCYLKACKFPAGASCIYIKINRNLGVKCYPLDKKNRDFSFKNQKYLYKKSLAPKAFFKFELYNPFDSKLKIFCYVTQHAKRCEKNIFRKFRYSLYDKLLNVGFECDDMFQRNCGMMGRNMVLIDCDMYSISNT